MFTVFPHSAKLGLLISLEWRWAATQDKQTMGQLRLQCSLYHAGSQHIKTLCDRFGRLWADLMAFSDISFRPHCFSICKSFSLARPLRETCVVQAESVEWNHFALMPTSATRTGFAVLHDRWCPYVVRSSWQTWVQRSPDPFSSAWIPVVLLVTVAAKAWVCSRPVSCVPSSACHLESSSHDESPVNTKQGPWPGAVPSHGLIRLIPINLRASALPWHICWFCAMGHKWPRASGQRVKSGSTWKPWNWWRLFVCR